MRKQKTEKPCPSPYYVITPAHEAEFLTLLSPKTLNPNLNPAFGPSQSPGPPAQELGTLAKGLQKPRLASFLGQLGFRGLGVSDLRV